MSAKDLESLEYTHPQWITNKIPAPLATEILEELPNEIQIWNKNFGSFDTWKLSIIRMNKGTYVVQYCDEDMQEVHKEFGDLSLPNALAKMYCYLAENNLLKEKIMRSQINNSCFDLILKKLAHASILTCDLMRHSWTRYCLKRKLEWK